MEVLQISLSIVLLLLFLASAILFLIQQDRLLRDIRPENRLLAPGKVWLQLIPIYGMIFQFTVIGKIADSIRNELSTESASDVLGADALVITHRPTYQRGLMLAILSCCSIIRIPILETLIALAVIIIWILYWVELRKYHRQIKLHLYGA